MNIAFGVSPYGELYGQCGDATFANKSGWSHYKESIFSGDYLDAMTPVLFDSFV
jgi:hypothetical protein